MIDKGFLPEDKLNCKREAYPVLQEVRFFAARNTGKLRVTREYAKRTAGRQSLHIVK